MQMKKELKNSTELINRSIVSAPLYCAKQNIDVLLTKKADDVIHKFIARGRVQINKLQ